MTLHITVTQLAEAIGLAFATGTLLLLLLTILPATRAAAGQLWPVLASEAAILAAGVLPWLLPPAGLFALLLAAAARIGFESGSVHGLSTGQPGLRTGCMLTSMLTCSASWFIGAQSFLVSWCVVLVASLAAARLRTGRTRIGSVAHFALFPLLPLAAFSHAASRPALWFALVLAFFLVEMFDSFSLLGGRLFGRTPLVPRLSPRKTWEGLAAGSAGLAVAVWGLAAWLHLPWRTMVPVGLLVIVSALTGDLLGSAAKRTAGIKDYPAVMSVQGGLLDITDSWLVAGPCLALLFTLWGGI